MMSEKRFRVNDLVKYVYSDIGEYVDENHTPTPLRNDKLCKLLNELNDENQQLKKEIKRLKCMNNQLERRLDYSIAYDMEECE